MSIPVSAKKKKYIYISMASAEIITQRPVNQSTVSLTSSLVVKILTVLVSKISNLHVFLQKKKKNVSSGCTCKSYSHFFDKAISVYTIVNDQTFDDTLTNYIISFWTTGSRVL